MVEDEDKRAEPPGGDEYGGGSWSDEIGLRVFQPALWGVCFVVGVEARVRVLGIWVLSKGQWHRAWGCHPPFPSTPAAAGLCCGSSHVGQRGVGIKWDKSKGKAFL